MQRKAFIGSRVLSRFGWVAVVVLAATSAAVTQVTPDVQFLPGDLQLEASDALQRDPYVASGGDVTLLVWADYRTSPDVGPPTGTDLGGSDIYAVRIDATGIPLDPVPLVLTDLSGDQGRPRAAWNGTHWLVTWTGPDRLGFSNLVGVRVAADGTVVGKPVRIVNGSSTNNYELIVNGDSWLVAHQLGTTVRAVRVAADGTVLDPGGIELLNRQGLSGFEIESAAGEYLLSWWDFNTRNGARFDANLQPIGEPFALQGTQIASNGTEYFHIWTAQGQTVGSRITPEGVFVDPDGVAIIDGGSVLPITISWDGIQWWIVWFDWFEGIKFARVSATGHVLDFNGVAIEPAFVDTMEGAVVAGIAGGGAQLAWTDRRAGGTFAEDIYTARASAAGVPEPSAPVSNSRGSQRFVDIEAGDGQALVVFRRDVAGNRTILAQRVDADGVALDSEPFALDSGVSLGRPRAAWNGTVYLVAWSNGGQGRARRVGPDGTVLDSTPIDLGSFSSPDVAALGDVFLAAGTKPGSSVYFYIPVTKRIDGTTGAVLDASPTMLGAYYARQPRVVALDDRWLVTWQRNWAWNTTDGEVRAAFVEADGTSAGDFYVGINIYAPDVAYSGSDVLFAYRLNSTSNANNDVAARRMLPDGTFVGPSIVVSAEPGRQVSPVVTWNGTDYVMFWSDKRHGNRNEVYGARIDAAGNLVDPDGFSFAGPTRPEIHPAVATIDGKVLVAASIFDGVPGTRAYRIGYDLMGDEAPGNRWPVAVATATPSMGPIPLPVDFDSAGSLDPDGAVVGYDWDFGDGTTAQGPQRVHTYEQDDDYLVQMQALDDLGAETIQTILVRSFPPSQPPVAVASASTVSGEAPLQVIHYAAGSYDPDGAIAQYWWDFDDGSGSYNQTANHTYSTPGVYEATLTVTDNDSLTSTASVTIWVGTSPGPGECPDGGAVPGVPLTLAKVAGGDGLSLSWGGSCAAASDYAIYRGAIGSWTSHAPVACTTNGVTTRTLMVPSLSGYYLIVPTDGTQEGSYGRSTSGVERAQGVSACLPQMIGSSCL